MTVSRIASPTAVFALLPAVAAVALRAVIGEHRPAAVGERAIDLAGERRPTLGLAQVGAETVDEAPEVFLHLAPGVPALIRQRPVAA